MDPSESVTGIPAFAGTTRLSKLAGMRRSAAIRAAKMPNQAGDDNKMNPEKVVFGFFIILALTLNFGFFIGEIDNPDHHHVYELFAVVVVNLIATVLKFGDRSQMGALLLATSLVANLQLIGAAVVWVLAEHVYGVGLTPVVTASIVSLSGGALLANVISVVLLIIETVMLRR
jgi:hypothetical protein